jgi:xanthine dehydrogenase accessory factor
MQGQLDFFQRVAALGQEGTPFATAIVVGRRAPVSAHLGDRAIVFADGRLEGFVGGACAREIVRKQALEALSAGAGRLVSIRPDASGTESNRDRVVVPMTCASEGAVDVYIEPFVRAPLLVVVGATPIAGALARVARSLDYRVVRVVEDRERADLEPEASALGFRIATLEALGEQLRGTGTGNDDRAVVVASQGHYDEEALESALTCGVPYVGLVASRTRGTTMRALLEEKGVPGVAALRNPAGLDLGARTPPDVALSILAEIVQARSRQLQVQAASASTTIANVPAAAPSSAIDPVCGMEVNIATARHKADLDGVTYYFCCAGCRARFERQPSDYLSRTP